MPPCSSVASGDRQTLTLAVPTLIPGLPNDAAALILAYVPYSHHSRLKVTCKSWKSFFSHKTLISFRRRLLSPKSRSHLLCIFPQDPSISSPYLFDVQNLAWTPLPPMPCNPHVYGLCNFASISLGSQIYVLGGSLFDTRSFPMDRPCASSAGFRFDFSTFMWEKISPMISPRGSFACAVVPGKQKIVVAGGGSRHTLFAAAGDRVGSVEIYDSERDEWAAVEGMLRSRAGCVGFFTREEFWVMGGYGESRIVSGVFPVDTYYRDSVVMELGNGSGGRWKEVGDMWREGERLRLGKIVVVEDEYGHGLGVFMLDRGEILRYGMDTNRWWKETSVPGEGRIDSSVGFVALNGELHIMTLVKTLENTEARRLRQPRSGISLFVQIYNPRKKLWRSLISKSPLHHQLDFKTAVMCTIRL